AHPALRTTPNCGGGRLPLRRGNDCGARDSEDSGERKRHVHFSPAANTGLAWLIAQQPHRSAAEVESALRAVKKNAEFLRGTDPEGKDKKVRIDLFGIKGWDRNAQAVAALGLAAPSLLPQALGGLGVARGPLPDPGIDGSLIKLRPELPPLTPGETYLVEVVIRTLGLGHPFTQGTADSNEVWVDFEAKSGKRSLGRSGGMVDKKEFKGEMKYSDLDLSYVTPDDRRVDKWTHFVNVLMLDREGNRINRRNPQDIFTPLYNHQIPPG